MRHRSGTLPPAGGPERDAQLDSYLKGASFPQGGAGRIARTFETGIEASGGAIKVSHEVTAILTEGGVQAARLSARPILRGSQACQASRRILDRYRRCGPREAEQSSFRVIAAACSRYGFTLVDHIVVVASGVPSKPSTPVVPSDHDF